MKKLVFGLALLFAMAFAFAPVHAQTTGAIAGTIVDAAGAVVPGANVLVKGEAGQEYSAVTSGNGTYNIPSVASGNYTVSVSAANFKTSIVQNVKVDVGTPATVDVSLEAGRIEETVVVTGGGEVLQTQTPTVGTTITGRQITEIPLTSRDALDLVTLLPGTTTVGRPRTSSINALPKGAINITIDGVDVQDNLLRSSDGFFTYVRPRLDAIDEVNVSTAAQGAENSGDGAVQIRFVTRRGTNDYRGNLFWQHRDEGLNSNYWWNNRSGLPRNKIRLNQYGGSFGGPLPLPGFGEGTPPIHSGKDRSFFFINYEEFRIPESLNRQRTVLSPTAQSGVYNYIGARAAGDPVPAGCVAVPGSATQIECNINLFTVAMGAGLTSTPDPTIAALLGQIRSSLSAGTVSPFPGDKNRQLFDFQNPGGQDRRFLALRFDFNLARNHSLENVTNYQQFRNGVDFLNSVDPAFPGFPNFGGQDSNRYSNTTALRSTLTKNLVNEVRYSFSGGLSLFRENLSVDQFANQGGRNLAISAAGITNATAVTSNNRRVSPTFDLSDNATWLFGNHAIGFGGQYKRIKLRTASINQIVPQVTFTPDLTNGADPLTAVFTQGNFPGASAGQLAAAASLYSVLVGRVYGFNGNHFLTEDGTYEFLGDQLLRAKQDTYGLYAQDQWRIRPNLTLNFGLRWQPQEGYTVRTANFSKAERFEDVYGISGPGGLFNPGVMEGRVPIFLGVEPGEKAFDTDFNNFAPSVGVVWSPSFGSGVMKTLFGSGGTSVIRAGYSTSFVREGTNVLLSILGSNPGGSLPGSRSPAAGTLPFGTLLRDPGALVPLALASNTPNYPLTATTANTINVFDPELSTGKVHSWSVGYQREIDKNTVAEIRYVGNRSRGLWRQYSPNELNLLESGLGAEFRLAQQNMIANNLAGGARAGSFAYFGPGTGTSPLPKIVAYFNAVSAANAGNQALYTSALFRNATFLNLLSPLGPNPFLFYANVNAAVARRNNLVAAGYPSNLLIVNPNVLGAAAGNSFIGGTAIPFSVQNGPFIVDNSANTEYDAMVIEVRRRLSQGLLVQASYTYSKAFTDAYASSSTAFAQPVTLRDDSLNKVASPFDVRHGFKANWIYELPFGRGKTFFGGANGLSNGLIGGWSVIGAFRWSSGAPFSLGNVSIVGMTREELQKLVGVYTNETFQLTPTSTSQQVISYLPIDIVTNTIRANNVTATGFSFGAPTGRYIGPAGHGNCIPTIPGECGFSNLILYGPSFVRLDLSLSKKIRFTETRNVELRAAFYNALNNPQWRVGGWAADTVVNNLASTAVGNTGFGQLTTGTVYQDTSTTNDPGGRTVELILRINF